MIQQGEAELTALTNEELIGLWFQLRVIWAKRFCRKSLHFPELFNDINQIIPGGRRPVDVVALMTSHSSPKLLLVARGHTKPNICNDVRGICVIIGAQGASRGLQP